MSSEKLTFQPPHTVNPQEIAFVESLTKEEKELHLLATQMLGSSYFVGKTHAYNKWAAKQKEKTSSQ